MSSPKHALIFGASGISGWGVIEQLVSYPTKDTWTSIIGLTNRPLTKHDANLPEDERISLVSGVDLSGSPENVISALKAKVPTIGDITHVFFYSYIHDPKGETQFVANGRLVENALLALEALSPKLEHFILQTGGKTYGLGYPFPTPPQPWKEVDSRSKHPEVQKDMFYYAQVDAVSAHSKKHKYAWTEIIPDAIIGFAPTANAMNLARSLAVYLFIYRGVHGEGAEVPYVGSQAGYTAIENVSPMAPIARLSIFAALNTSKTNGKSYNITERATSWSKVWPAVVALFGLKGAAPGPTPVDLVAFASEHANVWAELEKKHGLKSDALKLEETSGGWGFLSFQLTAMSFDREYDNTERFNVGFDEEIDTVQAFKDTWRQFAEFKVLPEL